MATRVSQSDALSELEEGQIPGIAGYGAISSKPATPLLDTINFPSHLKNLSADQLEQVAKELRADLITTCLKRAVIWDQVLVSLSSQSH